VVQAAKRDPSPPKRKEMSAEQRIKLAALRQKYGDGSGEGDRSDSHSKPANDSEILRLGH